MDATNIIELTPDTFAKSLRLRLEYGNSTEDFVLTSIGRFRYAVSISHGYAYTRPQLIEKYGKVGTVFTATGK